MSRPRPSTDPQDEELDVLDGNGVPTGARKRRGDVHRDGDWHAALHVWIGGVDEEGRPFALFQRRSSSKDTWPDAIDVAVGGHLRAGEGVAHAVREAEEEIGLSVSVAQLVRLGRRFVRGTAVADNEVQEAFALRSDLPLDRYRLHPDEVAGVLRLPLDEAIALFERRRARVRGLELERGSSIARPVEATVGAFAAADRDGYPALALRGLAEVIAGRTPEPFELR